MHNKNSTFCLQKQQTVNNMEWDNDNESNKNGTITLPHMNVS